MVCHNGYYIVFFGPLRLDFLLRVLCLVYLLPLTSLLLVFRIVSCFVTSCLFRFSFSGFMFFFKRLKVLCLVCYFAYTL
jgi:hypothetical protein